MGEKVGIISFEGRIGATIMPFVGAVTQKENQDITISAIACRIGVLMNAPNFPEVELGGAVGFGSGDHFARSNADVAQSQATSSFVQGSLVLTPIVLSPGHPISFKPKLGVAIQHTKIIEETISGDLKNVTTGLGVGPITSLAFEMGVISIDFLMTHFINREDAKYNPQFEFGASIKI